MIDLDEDYPPKRKSDDLVVVDLAAATDQTHFKTSAHVLNALRLKYNKPDFAFFPQVRDKAGFDAERTADAMAMGLWKSRGYDLHGFEIKISRADWLRELKEPGKAEALCRYCDRWWIVVSNASIVKAAELPSNWGLIIPRGNDLVVKVPAPKLEPEVMTKSFLGSLLRRAVEYVVTEDEIKVIRSHERDLVKQQYEETTKLKHIDKNNIDDNGVKAREYFELEQKVREFEIASGISIQYAWNLGQVGNALKLLMDGGHSNRATQVKYFLESQRAHLEGFQKFLNEIEEFDKGVAG